MNKVDSEKEKVKVEFMELKDKLERNRKRVEEKWKEVKATSFRQEDNANAVKDKKSAEEETNALKEKQETLVRQVEGFISKTKKMKGESPFLDSLSILLSKISSLVELQLFQLQELVNNIQVELLEECSICMSDFAKREVELIFFLFLSFPEI